MTDEQISQIITILLSQIKQTARVADALEIVARNTAPEAPNYQRPIFEYRDFDWDSIGAEVIGSDDDGPTVVSWGDFTWQRRAPQNKFAEAIWFSRPIGKNADGQVRYARLITFKTTGEAEPIPAKVAKAVEAGADKAPQQPHTAPRAEIPAPAPSQPNPVQQDAPRPAQDTPRPTPKPPAQANGKPAPAPRYDPLKDERLKGLKKPSMALDLPGVVASTTLYYHLSRLFVCDPAKAAHVWAEAQAHGDAAQAIRALDDVILPF